MREEETDSLQPETGECRESTDLRQEKDAVLFLNLKGSSTLGDSQSKISHRKNFFLLMVLMNPRPSSESK
jgi:hypothetical protein